MPEETENWIADFSNELGFPLDMTLLRSAGESFEKHPRKEYLLEHHLEFSFYTSSFSSPKTLRYAIDVTKLDRNDVEKLIRLAISLLGKIPGKAKFSPSYQRLNAIVDETGKHLPDGVGAEHDLDGSVSSFKTYWRFKSPLDQFRALLLGDNEKYFKKLLSTVQTFWPGWESARGIGIDYLPSGGNRFKAYLPQKNYARPLSLESFCAFLLSLGWKVHLDTFPKLSYFLLDRQTEVVPTAYLLGLAIGDTPSIKLEIVTKAYFNGTEETLSAILGLAESLGLDSSHIYNCVAALQKHNPLARLPTIETMCLDFYPDSSNRITLYCRL
jgi:hypothetical protein